MRHGIKGRKLSRTKAHRKSTLQSLAMALIKEHRIVTTVAKAKELRGFIEPLITRAKVDSHHNRQQVFSSIQNKDAVSTLFTEIGPKCADRPGGYTRVIKAGFRKGDGAELAIIELVDYNDIKPEGSSSDTKKKRTRRAGKSNTPTSAPAKEENKEEVPKQAENTSADAATDESKADEESATEETK
jgi:large subunit ribosomal protein L17